MSNLELFFDNLAAYFKAALGGDAAVGDSLLDWIQRGGLESFRPELEARLIEAGAARGRALGFTPVGQVSPRTYGAYGREAYTRWNQQASPLGTPLALAVTPSPQGTLALPLPASPLRAPSAARTAILPASPLRKASLLRAGALAGDASAHRSASSSVEAVRSSSPALTAMADATQSPIDVPLSGLRKLSPIRGPALPVTQSRSGDIYAFPPRGFSASPLSRPASPARMPSPASPAKSKSVLVPVSSSILPPSPRSPALGPVYSSRPAQAYAGILGAPTSPLRGGSILPPTSASYAPLPLPPASPRLARGSILFPGSQNYAPLPLPPASPPQLVYDSQFYAPQPVFAPQQFYAPQPVYGSLAQAGASAGALGQSALNALRNSVAQSSAVLGGLAPLP
ncbi:Hypothetical protein POVN_LOCUS597 [uncultured virus]|nr:Hypothetical protein POVN_LOCUS597 [uncultured virus]